MSNLTFTNISHLEALLWIDRNNRFLNKVHKSFKQWISAHPVEFRRYFIQKPYYWTGVLKDNEIVGMIFCCLSKQSSKKKLILYNGYKVILPSLRGLGIGRKLDLYHYEWTVKLFNWNTNIIFVEKHHAPYNKSIGFKLVESINSSFDNKKYFLMCRTRVRTGNDNDLGN